MRWSVPDRHAHVRRPNHHRHPRGAKVLLNRLGNLPGQPLLNLRPPRKHLNGPRQFAQPDHLAPRGQVRHIHRAHKRQQVMLAHRRKRNPSQHDGPVGFLVEDSAEMLGRVLRKTAEDLAVRPGHPGRGIEQAVAIRVFTDGEEDLANRRLNTGLIDAGATGQGRRDVQSAGLDSVIVPAAATILTVESCNHGVLPADRSKNVQIVQLEENSTIGLVCQLFWV